MWLKIDPGLAIIGRAFLEEARYSDANLIWNDRAPIKT